MIKIDVCHGIINIVPFLFLNKEQDLNSTKIQLIGILLTDNQKLYERTMAALRTLNYGNENLGSYKSYWMEDSLKISNLEQEKSLKI